ncbi:MAG TPA: histidinol-phosphate transaminase, partial [Petrimonas sp.]|nr:histidinol-phosphate transaminase [Petrimonas sp.]
SDANFLLVEVSDANWIYNELVQKKVIVRNRNRQVTNCVRITIGTPGENEELLNKLRTLV